ncbi:hypothetical protein [Moraxella lacunata]|uniref:hypothetical protein n=1 Tax=Moraxella lacunata TaxID=477 RepID=UPI003EE024B2
MPSQVIILADTVLAVFGNHVDDLGIFHGVYSLNLGYFMRFWRFFKVLFDVESAIMPICLFRILSCFTNSPKPLASLPKVILISITPPLPKLF